MFTCALIEHEAPHMGRQKLGELLSVFGVIQPPPQSPSPQGHLHLHLRPRVPQTEISSVNLR